MTPRRICTRTTLALPWLLNGTLPAPYRRQVREHLIRCPACRAELAQTRATLAMFSEGREAGAIPVASGFAGQASARPALHQHSRRLTWAVAAALLVSLAGVWAVREIDRDHMPEVRAVRPDPAEPGPSIGNRRPQLIFRNGFDDGKLTGWRQQL